MMMSKWISVLHLAKRVLKAAFGLFGKCLDGAAQSQHQRLDLGRVWKGARYAPT